MSFGRRGGAPTSPPIPMPAPPPAAYGIAVPGAPAVPPMPPPPAVPPPLPQQYAAPQQYAPPVPQAAPPADLSGFFGGPAAPPPTTFGGPSQFGGGPSQFGGPPQFGAPARPGMEYGAPAWQSAPVKKSNNRLLIRVGISLTLFLTIGGGGRWAYDHLNRRHVGTLPVMLGDYALDNGAQAQTLIEQTTARLNADQYGRQVKHFQMGVYRAADSALLGFIADLPASSSGDRTRFMEGFSGGASMQSFGPVTPGHQGGSENCGLSATGAVCVWVDDGTLGSVVVPGGDVTAAQFYLQKLRDGGEG